MGELFAKLLELFTSGTRKTMCRLLLILVLIGIVAPFGIRYFWGNVHLLQQIEILERLAEIDAQALQDERLQDFHDSLLEQLSVVEPAASGNLSTDASERPSFGGMFRDSNLWKFISGSSIGVLMLVIVFFAKYNSTGMRLSAAFLMAGLSFILGAIGAIIPTFTPLLINIIGYPVLQMTLLVYIVYLVSKKGRQQPADQVDA